NRKLKSQAVIGHAKPPKVDVQLSGVSSIAPAGFLLHDSLNRNRFKDKIMQPFKVLQRPLRV
ncbi:hypothetical protein E0H64_11245, partial [Rhizobium leguminosarum bv. viciae]